MEAPASARMPSNRLVVYTDGVPEATNASNTLYGTDRMLRALNAAEGGSCRQLLEALHRDVDEFAGGADQFDDITMLCIEMKDEHLRFVVFAELIVYLFQHGLRGQTALRGGFQQRLPIRSSTWCRS